MKSEPVRTRGVIAAVVELLLIMGVAVPMQAVGPATTILLALIPLITWLQAELARRRVTPVGPGSRVRE